MGVAIVPLCSYVEEEVMFYALDADIKSHIREKYNDLNWISTLDLEGFLRKQHVGPTKIIILMILIWLFYFIHQEPQASQKKAI